MAHCTQLCTTKKKFYSQQIKNFFLGITLFDTFSLLFQKEKNLMPLFLIACNRGLNCMNFMSVKSDQQIGKNCYLNLETKLFSDMHCPFAGIQAKFVINRHGKFDVTNKQKYFHKRRTDS